MQIIPCSTCKALPEGAPFFWKRGILVQYKEWISRRIQKRRKKNSISGWYTSYHTPRWLSFTCSCTVLSHHRTHGISARPFFPATFIPANTTRCEVRSWMREKKRRTEFLHVCIPPAFHHRRQRKTVPLFLLGYDNSNRAWDHCESPTAIWQQICSLL